MNFGDRLRSLFGKSKSGKRDKKKRRPDNDTIQIPPPVDPQPNGYQPEPSPPAPPGPKRDPSQDATVILPPPGPLPAPLPINPGGRDSDGSTHPSPPTLYDYKVPAGSVVGVLVAVDGHDEGEVFRVVDGENKLGRDPDCKIQFRDTKVSRQHARLVHQDGGFAIAPLSDKNPTLVNGKPTDGTGTELGDGDYVKVGRTVLHFRSVRPPPS